MFHLLKRLTSNDAVLFARQIGIFFLLFAFFESTSAAPSKTAECMRCITTSPSYNNDKASCMKAVPCKLPGQCFKAVFEGGLTIRGCPQGAESNVASTICDKIPKMVVDIGGSLANKFNNAANKMHFDSSCSPSCRNSDSCLSKPKVFLCRGPACNGGAELTSSKVGAAIGAVLALLAISNAAR